MIDLAGGFYTDPQGGVHPGGLYDTGQNARPPEIDAVMPVVTPVAGKLGVALMGASTIRLIGDALLPLVAADPLKAPKVKFCNGAIGGKRTDSWANPNDSCWTTFASRLASAGISPNQLRVVLFMDFANAGTGTFEGDVAQNTAWIDAVIANISAKYPSVRTVYLSSHHYVGYSGSVGVEEPLAYIDAWSIQRVVRLRAGTNTPWTVVGAYPWTNGEIPRADGKFYICSDFQQDGNSAGVHMDPPGASKAALDFLSVLQTDTSTVWYRVSGV